MPLSTERFLNDPNPLRLLENERLLLGLVEEIRGQEVRVNTGDLMPRYVSLRQAGDKHRTTPRVGDMVLLIVKNQNNVIHYHVYGEDEWYILVNGKILKSVQRDRYSALIQFQSEKIKTTPIDSVVWNKFAVFSVGTTATFVLDSTHTIVDSAINASLRCPISLYDINSQGGGGERR